MKTKLLKKIRKRYGWYINKEGIPILIDHKLKSLTIIDEEEVRKYFGVGEEFKIKISINEWLWRNLKTRMYQQFGFSMERVWYNKFMRLSKRSKRLKTLENHST